MTEKATSTTGPITQPSCAIAQASDRTPEPITAVMMCALAVTSVPVRLSRPSSSRSGRSPKPASTTLKAAAFPCCCLSITIAYSFSCVPVR
uniref:Uncharacterized protein n=1 Tax=Arundo donax TaxID=35708 RepID=A0A0A9EN41_ARUDO